MERSEMNNIAGSARKGYGDAARVAGLGVATTPTVGSGEGEGKSVGVGTGDGVMRGTMVATITGRATCGADVAFGPGVCSVTVVLD